MSDLGLWRPSRNRDPLCGWQADCDDSILMYDPTDHEDPDFKALEQEDQSCLV